MKATELIESLDMTGEDIIEPISKLFRANIITIDQFTELVEHTTKVYMKAQRHGYWKAIQLTKGDNFVEQTLGDGRTEKE